jgi:cytochrome c-type biogenesis protein CcmF
MKAIIFPWINLLWLGSLFMVAGFLISMYKRMGDRKRNDNKQHAVD